VSSVLPSEAVRVKALGAQPNSPPAPGELCFITSDEELEARTVGQLKADVVQTQQNTAAAITATTHP
jgi:hypothetical protein